MRRLLLGAVRLVCALGMALPLAAQEKKAAVLPYVGSAPETGLQLGVAYLRTWQPEDTLGTRPSSRMGNIVFTQKDQFRAFIESDKWTAGNAKRRQWGAIVALYPLPFYGYSVNADGPRQTIDNRSAEFWVTASRKGRTAVWNSLGARLVLNTTPEQDLGWCPGGDSTFVVDCAPPPAIRHTTLLVTAARTRDTRDFLFAPTTGRFIDLSLTGMSTRERGRPESDLYFRFRAEARGYRTRGRHTIAVQGLLINADPYAPLDQQVVMGSNTMLRGYEMGRLRADFLLGAQAEWRVATPLLRERLGFALFGGGAQLDSEFDYDEGGTFFPSVGGGIRFRLDARTRSAVRIDFGVGRKGNSGLYVAFNEAF